MAEFLRDWPNARAPYAYLSFVANVTKASVSGKKEGKMKSVRGSLYSNYIDIHFMKSWHVVILLGEHFSVSTETSENNLLLS